jgi:23S rRNA (guanosine2251-2'-O)-methyltransferase
MKRELIVIMHNIRSIHNVGSIIRTSEGIGATKIIFSGYTPFPKRHKGEDRLPHLANKIDSQINKTALGAQNNIDWVHTNQDPIEIAEDLKKENYQVLSLEQAPNSTQLKNYVPTSKMALFLGNEVSGVNSEIMDISDTVIEIEMNGKKESLNVSNAAAIAIYRLIILP